MKVNGGIIIRGGRVHDDDDDDGTRVGRDGGVLEARW